jgi:hypothetical protein
MRGGDKWAMTLFIYFPSIIASDILSSVYPGLCPMRITRVYSLVTQCTNDGIKRRRPCEETEKSAI